MYSAPGPLRLDFVLASAPLCSADIAERCRGSSCIFARPCWAALNSRCCGCREQGATAATGWGRSCSLWVFRALPEPCRAPADREANRTSERLKGIEKGSSRTSSEVFPQPKYLYSSDVGFTSTHSTPAGRACKYKRGLYVLTTCSHLPLSLWLSLLPYLLFFVYLDQGNVVSGMRANSWVIWLEAEQLGRRGVGRRARGAPLQHDRSWAAPLLPKAHGAGEVWQCVPRNTQRSPTGIHGCWAPRAPAGCAPGGVKRCGDPSPGCRLRLSCYRHLCCLHHHFLQLALNRQPHSSKGVPLFSPDGQSKRKGCGKWSYSFPHALPPRTTASSPPWRDEI